MVRHTKKSRRTRRRKQTKRVYDSFRRAISPYIHTPWVDNTPVDPRSNVTEAQHHGGNLLEHSLWTKYQIKDWIRSNDALAHYINPKLAVTAGYIHDIGKAGDCVFDLYSPMKYGGQPDRIHAIIGADMIMGKIPFGIGCKCMDNVCRSTKTLNVRELLTKWKVYHLRRELAVVVAMHWELGAMNMNSSESLSHRADKYISTFFEMCSRYDTSPTLQLLCTCIIVAAADISAGTSDRLRGRYRVPHNIYPSKDSWIAYKMNERVHKYRESIITRYLLTHQ
jgi:hypothetical protein